MRLAENFLSEFRVHLFHISFCSMKKINGFFIVLIVLTLLYAYNFREEPTQAWIRINQLGYLPNSKKAGVWCSKDSISISNWQLIDAQTKKIATSGKAGKAFGAYGPFKQSYRLDFSHFSKPGKYYLQAGGARSPIFEIGENVYKGSADFALRYMRQQRCGFNPYLKDSCHNRGAYSLYGAKAGIPDSSYVPVWGGWHDASDYLQYSTTSANAAYNLLLAYRDFPQVFSDSHLANGLEGENNLPDIVDEAQWGIDWLMKMNPSRSVMYNQVADDRDHINMRMPALDSQYGRGYQRPVYFVSGEPQQRGKLMNSTTGTSSISAKFASVYALAYKLKVGSDYKLLYNKAMDAWLYESKKPGYTQTASVKSPYI
ncbi:MAG: cellulase, partial [Chitinophagaceae bacterium]